MTIPTPRLRNIMLHTMNLPRRPLPLNKSTNPMRPRLTNHRRRTIPHIPSSTNSSHRQSIHRPTTTRHTQRMNNPSNIPILTDRLDERRQRLRLIKRHLIFWIDFIHHSVSSPTRYGRNDMMISNHGFLRTKG